MTVDISTGTLEKDDDGTIRRRDVDGNTEDVLHPGEEGYDNLNGAFDAPGGLPAGHKLVAYYGSEQQEYATVEDAINGIEDAHANSVDLDSIIEVDAEKTTIRTWGATWKVSLEPQDAE